MLSSRVDDVCAFDTCPRRQDERTCPDSAADLAHRDASDEQRVSDERAMAAPGHRLGAHQDDPLTGRQFDALADRRLERRRLHVIGEPSKTAVAPSEVDRVGTGPPQSPQTWHVRVPDMSGRQRCGEPVIGKLWIVTRAWNLPYVHQMLDLVPGQELEKRVDRPGGMANRENRHWPTDSLCPECLN